MRVSRGLRIVAADDAGAVQRALAEAMAGGPVVLPRDAALGVELRADAAELEALWASEAGRFDADACLIIETSGSTGAPKRVVLTARALHASAAATYEWLDARGGGAGAGGGDAAAGFPTRQWLHCLPAHYIAGSQVLLRSLVAGTRPVELRGRFTAEALVDAAEGLEGERRYASLVPVQLQRLLEAARAGDATAARVDAAMRRFDGVLVGGQATPRPVLDAARARGWPIVTTYGASETSGGCVYDGEPLPGVRARLDEGELLLAGPQLASGYLGDPERDASAFVELDGERWYRTSDAGSISDDAGRVRLSVTGRLDHVIISGGEKANLDVVERLVQRLPGYEQAVAVAVPHPEWGQAVAIVVAGAAPADGGDELELLRRAAEPAGRAGRPVRCLRIPELPRLASGKPDRRAIAALAAGG